MEESLRSAMEPVMRDLQSDDMPVPEIVDEDWVGDPDSVSVMLRSPDGSAVGAQVSLLDSPVERVVSMADQVQEWVIEELRGQASTSWPACPHHPETHPLQATQREGGAVWSCPVDFTPFTAVGASKGPSRDKRG